MARDYSKYNVDGVGENLNKRKLVLRIVQDYVKKNNPSYEELKKIFPDDLQGSTGMIRNAISDKYDVHRFFWKDRINVQDQFCVVSNQWGTDNIQQFINYAIEQLGYKISSDTRMESANEKSTKESQAMKKINITISGRITNYMFGILGDEAYAECLKAMSFAINGDVATIGEFLRMFFETILEGDDGIEIFQESFDMGKFQDNCPILSEFLDKVKVGDAGHLQFYEEVLDMDTSEEVNFIEDDAFITVTVDGEEIVPQTKLIDFLGQIELYVEVDTDPKAVSLVKEFWRKNGAKFNMQDRDEYSIHKAQNGVLLLHEWIEPVGLTQYNTRKRNITAEHDNIVYFDFFFNAIEFDLSKLIFLGFANSDFHHSGLNYVGSYLSYDCNIIRPDQNIIINKGFTLYYEDKKKSCNYFIEA